jgi:dCMP deaminase
MNKWDKRFMDLVDLVATWSKDTSTQVGAVIVDNENTILSVGYNGFPRGVDDSIEERFERPQKYMYTEHAERNAIYNAVRNGLQLKGAKIYIPWCSCSDCARAIIQSGIKTVVMREPDYDVPKWGEHFKIAIEMYNESGVKVIYYNDEKGHKYSK